MLLGAEMGQGRASVTLAQHTTCTGPKQLCLTLENVAATILAQCRILANDGEWLPMVNSARARLLLAITLLALLSSVGGCLKRVGSNPKELSFSLPTTLTIERGATLVGTDIRYDSTAEDGIYLLIGGQRALKRTGDSVKWSGSPVAGADVELDLRVVWHTEEQVNLAGKASVVVRDVAPEPGIADTSSQMSFSGPVAYGIPVGGYIPGTTLTYVGETEQGAELGGLYNEYPYRQVGDSIVWEGRLRDGVHLRMELRTVQFDGNGLRVAGLATLWLGP